MGPFSSADRSSPAARVSRSRRCARPTLAFLPHARALSWLTCVTGALLLMALAGSALFLFWAGEPAAAAQAATACAISSLPPTPTSGDALDPGSIKLSEILTNPEQDWNCDGAPNQGDEWIELKNTSGKDESLAGLQLGVQDQATILLNTGYRIAANGYLAIFSAQIRIPLVQSFGQLQLLDGSGNIIDAVNYPPLGAGQSYSRTANGQWQTTSTPTPGAANIFTSGSKPTPTPTATRRSGGSGGGGTGSGSRTPTATPTPIGSVFIPTDTPSSGIALQNPGDTSSDSSGGGGDPGFPAWFKTALIALIGLALLGVVIWYWRTWNQEPEGDG